MPTGPLAALKNMCKDGAQEDNAVYREKSGGRTEPCAATRKDFSTLSPPTDTPCLWFLWLVVFGCPLCNPLSTEKVPMWFSTPANPAST